MSEIHVQEYDDRDHQIRLAISNGLHPILPLEEEMLLGRMGDFLDRQQVLGRELGEAMQESSETWHDNAPAEAISAASRILASQAITTMRTQEKAVTFEYPHHDYKIATIGSIVDVRLSRNNTEKLILLTGVVRAIDHAHQMMLPEGIALATIQSPLGFAIFGRKPGDEIAYSVGDNRSEAVIRTVTQYNPAPAGQIK